jgi:hypothetical protein
MTDTQSLDAHGGQHGLKGLIDTLFKGGFNQGNFSGTQTLNFI